MPANFACETKRYRSMFPTKYRFNEKPAFVLKIGPEETVLVQNVPHFAKDGGEPLTSLPASRFIQQRVHLAAQCRQVNLQHSPNQFICNRSVAMDQTVAEGNDPLGIANAAG